MMDALNCLGNTFSKVTAGISVPQFMRFVDTGGCTGGDGCSANDAIFQNHVNFDGGIATGIQYFTADDVLNEYLVFHCNFSFAKVGL